MMYQRVLLFSGLLWSFSTGCGNPSELISSGAPNGGPLFSSSEASQPISPLGLRSRVATFNDSLLASHLEPLEEPEEILLLNLFDDVQIEATRTRWIHLPNGGYSWHGVLVDDEHSEITLIQNDGFVSGNIRTDDQVFQIRTHESGSLTIEEVDLSILPEDEELPLGDDFEEGRSKNSETTTATEDAGTLIDVLVVYTKDAREGAGSKKAIETEILLAIAETNEGYTQSKVDQRVRLVDTVETPWNENEGTFSFYNTLIKATSKTDGRMDEIHALRDKVGADEVVIIVEGDNSSCGIAWLMTSPSTSFESYAFSVVARGCATGNYTFAHELGHNMGSTHDHNNADVAAYSYSYGQQIPEASVRTVMAYNCPDSHCRRLNRWSNPDQKWKGNSLGVSGTGPDAADNRLSLNTTAIYVAAFRDTPEAPEPDAPTFLAPLDGSTLTSHTLNILLGDVDADQYVIFIGLSVGAVDLGQYDMGGSKTYAIPGLPEDGRKLYVRGWAKHGSDWLYTDVVYTAHTRDDIKSTMPKMTSPVNGSTLTESNVTFEWTDSTATQVVIRLGRESDDGSIGQYGVGAATSFTVRHLPLDGNDIWVSLYAQTNGAWDVRYYQYKTVRKAQDIKPAG
jgi:hypothetical protein